MEVPLDLRSIVLVMTLFSSLSGTDAEAAQASPTRVVLHRSLRFPRYNQMPSRGYTRDEPKFWNSQVTPIVDPHIDSLMRSTACLIDTMRRLEIKFDRVFGAVNFEENVADDVLNKLRQIFQHIKGTSTNACKTDCSASANEMPQSNLMRELVDAVQYSNENIRKIVTNFDSVMEGGRRSMQSLENVALTVQDIDERTIRIQQISTGQFSGGISHLHRDETVGRESTSMVNTRLSTGSNDYDKRNEHNKNSTTPSNQPTTQYLAAQTNYNSTDRRGTFNKDQIPNIASPKSTYESTGDEVHSWGGNSQANFHDGGDKNRNTDRGTWTPTHYDSNGHVASEDRKRTDGDQNSLTTSNEQVNENRNYQEIKSDSKETDEIINYNQTPIVSRPSGREINNWNSYETFVGEPSYKWNLSQSNNGQQTQHNYDSNSSYAFDQNKEPVTTPSKTNYESSGNVMQSRNYAPNSTVQLKENENAELNRPDHVAAHNQTSYDSKGSVIIGRNGSADVTTTKTNNEPVTTEARSSNHLSNRNSNTNLTYGTKEVSDQTNGVATSAISNGSSSTTTKSNEQNLLGSANATTSSARKVITTTTTTTTTKAQTTANTTNSQRTYRSLRKDPKRVTFEENKRNCQDLTVKRNGIYKFGSLDEIANDGNRFFNERYCDFYTDNRAWTVIQRRFADDDKEESFNRTWLDYKHGFGSLEDEFWFGNDFIHRLTLDDDMELRIILQDEDGNTNWMEYSLFKMKSETDNYKLVIGGYSSSSVEADSLLYHNGQEFSTFDHRNPDTSCASSIGNGWWFKNCSDQEILGNFLGSTSTKMMIRPKK